MAAIPLTLVLFTLIITITHKIFHYNHLHHQNFHFLYSINPFITCETNLYYEPTRRYMSKLKSSNQNCFLNHFQTAYCLRFDPFLMGLRLWRCCRCSSYCLGLSSQSLKRSLFSIHQWWGCCTWSCGLFFFFSMACLVSVSVIQTVCLLTNAFISAWIPLPALYMDTRNSCC